MIINQLLTKSETKVKPLPAPADELSIAEHAFAAEYAATGNASRSFRAVFGNEPGRSAVAVRLAASDLALKPAVRARVAELRAIAAQALNTGVSDMALRCFEVGTASIHDLQTTEVYPCRVCYSADGHTPAWIDAAELAAAIDAHLKSLSGPMPRPMPSAAGGFNHDQFGPPSPSCRACRGHGIALLRVRASADLPQGAAQLADGVVLGGDGQVLRYTIADRSKYLDMLAKLTGSYAPTKVEGKHAHLHIHKQAPDTRTPMTAEEAYAVMGIDDSTVVSTQP
jgi:hypothetical protein